MFNYFKKKNVLSSISRFSSKQNVSSQQGERRMSKLSASSRRNSKLSVSSFNSKRRHSRTSELSKKRRASRVSMSSARRNSKVSLGSKGSNKSSKSSKKENSSAINMLSPNLKRQHRPTNEEILNEKQLTEVAEVEDEEIVMEVQNAAALSLAKKRQNSRRIAKKRENLRATFMLIVVCVLFLISEFPQFLLIIFSVNDNKFYKSIYVPLGDFLDVIVLINGSVSFILYCLMSSSFRKMLCSNFKFTRNQKPIKGVSVSNIFK